MYISLDAVTSHLVVNIWKRLHLSYLSKLCIILYIWIRSPLCVLSAKVLITDEQTWVRGFECLRPLLSIWDIVKIFSVSLFRVNLNMMLAVEHKDLADDWYSLRFISNDFFIGAEAWRVERISSKTLLRENCKKQVIF